MKRGFAVVTICIVVGGLANQLLAAPDSPTSSRKVMATVAGTAITEEQVEAAAEGELRSIDEQRMEIVSRTLAQIVEQKLLDLAAAKEGITRAQLIEREVEAKVTAPTPEDIDAFYEENKARVRQPKEQLTTQIQQQLIRDRKIALYQELIERLRGEFDVTSPFEEERAAAQVQRAAEIRKLVETPGHPAKGPANAPVTIVEFSDFQCPYCSRVLPVFEKIHKEYGGKVRIVFRQFPLSIHKDAVKAAEASLCAEAQGKFWEMHDAMFRNQKKLDVPSLKETAAGLGLDPGQFDQCLDSGKFSSQVRADFEVGQEAGVTGTPAMFVNGIFLRGAQPYEAFSRVIDAALARSAGKGSAAPKGMEKPGA